MFRSALEGAPVRPKVASVALRRIGSFGTVNQQTGASEDGQPGGTSQEGTPAKKVMKVASAQGCPGGARARQSALREVQACERTLANVDITLKEMTEDALTLTLTPQSLANSLQKLDRHLSPGLRWVYLAEDVAQCDVAAVEKRSQLLLRIQEASRIFVYFLAIARSYHASPDKNPLAFDARTLAQACADAVDAKLRLSLAYPAKVVERFAKAELQHAIDQYGDLWKDKSDGDVKSAASLSDAFDAWGSFFCVLPLIDSSMAYSTSSHLCVTTFEMTKRS